MIVGVARNGDRQEAVFPFYTGPVGIAGDGETAAYFGRLPAKVTLPVEGKIGDVAVTAVGLRAGSTKGMVVILLADAITLPPAAAE